MSNNNKPNNNDKKNINEQKPTTTSDYIGVPKIETVAQYVQSAYVWFKGFTESKPDTQGSKSQEGGQKIAPHLSVTKNILPTDKNKMTPDGEKLSCEVIKSDNHVSAEKIYEEAQKNGTKPLAPAPVQQPPSDIADSADLNSRGSANIQFSFLDQLRDLEDSKNRAFAVPDKDYFGGRDTASPVHKPNSYRLELQNPKGKEPKLGELLSGLLKKKKESQETIEKK